MLLDCSYVDLRAVLSAVKPAGSPAAPVDPTGAHDRVPGKVLASSAGVVVQDIEDRVHDVCGAVQGTGRYGVAEIDANREVHIRFLVDELEEAADPHQFPEFAIYSKSWPLGSASGAAE